MLLERGLASANFPDEGSPHHTSKIMFFSRTVVPDPHGSAFIFPPGPGSKRDKF